MGCEGRGSVGGRGQRSKEGLRLSEGWDGCLEPAGAEGSEWGEEAAGEGQVPERSGSEGEAKEGLGVASRPESWGRT